MSKIDPKVLTLHALVQEKANTQAAPGEAKLTSEEMTEILSTFDAGGLDARQKNALAFEMAQFGSGAFDTGAATQWAEFAKRAELTTTPIDDLFWQAQDAELNQPLPRGSIFGPDGAPDDSDEIKRGAAEPMPPAFLDYMDRARVHDRATGRELKWAEHHREWHGAPHTGIEFLEMHSGMFTTMNEEFVQQGNPEHAQLFAGKPPDDALFDRDPELLAAFERLKNPGSAEAQEFFHARATEMGVTPGEAFAKYAETTVHNYVHNVLGNPRGPDTYPDPRSPDEAREAIDINMGNPSTNMCNTQFWELHGWLEHAVLPAAAKAFPGEFPWVQDPEAMHHHH
jgi:hypothetical protein